MQKILQEQRAKSKIDPEALAAELFRGKERFERYVQMRDRLLSVAGPNDPRVFEMSRSDLIAYGHKTTNKLRSQIHPGVLEEDDPMAEFINLHNFHYPGSVGLYMVVQVLRTLGEGVQSELWPRMILNHIWFACYAQTELAMGNDTQNLKTQAIFDEKSQEFILHTPDVSRIKWWPGDLGLTATHALVVARLISRGRDYGVQSFFVELRNPKTHVPHAGVEIGDLGPKLGFHSRDNGFLRFTQYRVPKSSLLSKYIQVDAEGAVSRRGNPKRMYAGMMHMRSAITVTAYTSIFKAATIATRYSLYRTQFLDSKGREVPVYDYQLQRDKLFREIARAYLMALTCRTIFDQLRLNHQLTQKDDFSQLQNTHIILCICKATFSTWATLAHQNLIKACGGHGFSSYSGLPSIFTEEFPNQIVEGDNSVLLLQVARQLYKSFGSVKKGELDQLTGPFEFLKSFEKWIDFTLEEPKDGRIGLEQLLAVFFRATCFLLQKSALKMFQLVQQHNDATFVWNELMGDDNQQLTKVFSAQFVLESSMNHLKGIQNAPIRSAIERLVELAAINLIEEISFALIESNAINSYHAELLLGRRAGLLEELRDDGLVLAEGMQVNDGHLGSAIGMSDKDPYETLYSWAKQYGSLNQFANQIHPAIQEFQLKLAREREQKL